MVKNLLEDFACLRGSTKFLMIGMGWLAYLVEWLILTPKFRKEYQSRSFHYLPRSIFYQFYSIQNCEIDYSGSTKLYLFITYLNNFYANSILFKNCEIGYSILTKNTD